MKKKVSKVLSVMCSVATLATLFGINSASAMDEKELAQKLMHGGSKATGKRKRRREIHGPSPLKIETEKEIIEAIKKIGGLKKYISKVLLEKVESILKINPVKIERFKSGLKNVINELERRKKDLEEAKSGGKPVNDVNRWISEASSLEESLEGFKSDCERDLSFIMQETINDLRRDTGKLKDGISSENFANKWVFMFLKSIKLYRLREDVNVPVSVVGDVLDNTVKVEDVQLRMLVSFANHMKEVKMSLSTLGNGIDFSQLISAYIKLAELEDSSSVEDREFAEETLNPFFMGGKIPEVVNGKMVADIVNAMEAAEMAKAAKAEAKKAVEEEAKRSRVESLSSEAASADGCDSKTSSLDKEIDEAIEKIKEYEKYLKSEYSKIKQMVSGSISLLFEKVIKDEISRLQELRKKLECSKRGNESVDDVRELIRNEPSLNESLDDFKLECKRNLGNTTRKMFKSIWNVPLDRKESVSRNNIMNKLVVGFLGLCEKCNKEYSILKLDDDFFVAVVDDILNNEKDVKDADFRTFVFFAEHMMKKNAKVESEKKNDVLGKSCVCGIKFDEFVSSYIRLAKLGDGPLVGPRLEKLDDIFRKIYGRDEVIAVINEEIMEDIEEAEESLSSEAASADDSSSPDKEKIYDAIKKIDASIKQFLEPENLKIREMGHGYLSLRFQRAIEYEISRLQKLRKKLERAGRGSKLVGDVHELIRNEPSVNKLLDDFKLECKRNLGNIIRTTFGGTWSILSGHEEFVTWGNIMNKLIFGFLKSCEKYNVNYPIKELDDDFFVAVVDDIINNKKNMEDADLRAFISFAEHVMYMVHKTPGDKKPSPYNGVEFDKLVSTYIKLAKLGDKSLVGVDKDLDEAFKKIYGIRGGVIISKEMVEYIEKAVK